MDAARWYLLARSHDTTVDLDLDLAREQSSENPVYYVQYAHARIASMLAARRRRRASRGGAGGAAAQAGASRCTPAERALIEQLLPFPASSPRRSSGARRTASPRTRSSSRRASPPSTATAACSEPRPRVGRVAADRAVAWPRARTIAPLPGAARGERAGARCSLPAVLSRSARGRSPAGRRRRG